MSIKKQISKSKPTVKTTFSLDKELVNDATNISIIGDFNNWNAEENVMEMSKNGNFKAVIELEKEKDHEFGYLIDKQIWMNDIDADKMVSNPFGGENSVISL